MDAPSSMMHQETLAFRILARILKATKAGRGGCSDQSTSKTINRSSEVSTVPMEDSRAFCCEGHDRRSYSVEMAARDCAKSSIMLYEWEAFPEAAFRCSGPLGIFV